MTNGFHTALKTEIVSDFEHAGARFAQVKLRHSKSQIIDTLHVRPTTWTSSGLQLTDFLCYLRFERGDCPFLKSECYSRQIRGDLDVKHFSEAFAHAYALLNEGIVNLEACGIGVDRPEGWGFFFGRESEAKNFSESCYRGDGHMGAKSEHMKCSEDQYFRFILTWLESEPFKGWVTHYRPHHDPLSDEFLAALEFLGGFHTFADCPEFNFESCQWRAFAYAEPATFFHNPAELAHKHFDAHATNFSLGIQRLLDSHSKLTPFGISFLNLRPSPGGTTKSRTIEQPPPRVAPSAEQSQVDAATHRFKYDVAISFAGSERQVAETIAKQLRAAGFEVFYDNFYPEQLWGKDLAVLFDQIYRKESRFCLMFISGEYATRIWTTHERRSAFARMLQEKGKEYILPIRVDDTDLDGLAPTIGYLSLRDYSLHQIAALVLKKLHDRV